MINSAYISSSMFFSLNECFTELSETAKLFGTYNLVEKGRIFDGKSSVFLHSMDVAETGYELEDIEKIKLLLDDYPKTFIQIEYDDGETSNKILLAVIKAIGRRWPIVFDNCYNRIYSPAEINILDDMVEF